MVSNLERLLFELVFIIHVLWTEDEEIHSFKEGGVATDTRESIQRETATLTTVMDAELEESDPFVSSCYCKLVCSLLTSLLMA